MSQAKEEAHMHNCINVDTLIGILCAIKAQPDLANFRCRTTNYRLGDADHGSEVTRTLPAPSNERLIPTVERPAA
jgi:hypothetical protein